ncbi:type I 3-dehydroquinate dehydratase [Auritidibacter ignavus]|uniref:type I 3-dehydroquinate dehydratase n=1 Tax=Auritidibacter ignavus TaxID=678932 RepID=UPI002FE61707
MSASKETSRASYPRLTLGTAHFHATHPAIIAPLMGTSRQQILTQAESMRQHPDSSAVSVIEWRVDFYKKHAQPVKVATVYQELIELFDSVPVLATLRTSAEGGQAEVSDETYLEVVTALASTPGAIVIDVETARTTARQALQQLQANQVAAVGSYHDFEQTPSTFDILDRLQSMGREGYDLAKIAVTPTSPADVIRINEATYQAASVLAQPVITVAMGPLGIGSRLAGGVFGSAATFASLEAASAPGQIPVHLVAEVAQAIYSETRNLKESAP